MNIEEAKSIQLEDYLRRMGFNPVKQQGDSIWYCSPFREEKTPSFKVSASRNLWYDFGIGQGGDIITLAMELQKTKDISYALKTIEGHFPAAFRPTLEVLHLFPYFPYQFPVPVPLEAVLQYVKHLSVHSPVTDSFPNKTR